MSLWLSLLTLGVVWLVLFIGYLFMLFDDLKTRIDHWDDKDKWQDNELGKLRERISTLERSNDGEPD